jgi:hypothetical protein
MAAPQPDRGRELLATAGTPHVHATHATAHARVADLGMGGRNRTQVRSDHVGAEKDRRKEEREPEKLGLANHQVTSRICWSRL